MHRGKRNYSKAVEEYLHKHFHQWFKDHVARKDDVDITPEIEWLANGPNDIVRKFKEYNVHGFKFRTEKREQGLRTQNSGVVMSAVTKRFSGGIEQSSDDMYYGKLVDIIELNYFGKLRVVLFKCVCHMKPRDIYDMGNVNFGDGELSMEDIPFQEQHLENIEDLQLVREDLYEQERDEPTHEDSSDGDGGNI